MIVTKVKVPQSLLVYKYDSEYDILDVFIEKIVPSVSDEIDDGIYSHYDRKTNQFVGISIMDYTTKDTSRLYDLIPLDIDFKDINKKLFIKNI